MKNIYFKNNELKRIIKFNNIDVNIQNLKNNDKIIIKHNEINVTIPLPNSLFIKTFTSNNGFTIKQLIYHIYETLCKAIEYDMKKYPLSYGKKMSVQDIVNNYTLKCNKKKHTSSIKINKNIVYLDLHKH